MKNGVKPAYQAEMAKAMPDLIRAIAAFKPDNLDEILRRGLRTTMFLSERRPLTCWENGLQRKKILIRSKRLRPMLSSPTKCMTMRSSAYSTSFIN